MVRTSQSTNSQSIARSASGTEFSRTKSGATKPKAAKEIDRSWKKSQVQRGKPLKMAPPSPLAVRMQQDLQLAGMSERTQQSYLRAVRKLAARLADAGLSAG